MTLLISFDLVYEISPVPITESYKNEYLSKIDLLDGSNFFNPDLFILVNDFNFKATLYAMYKNLRYPVLSVSLVIQ